MNTFDFSTFPVLETKRLRLRELVPDDAASLMRLFSSPEVLAFLSQPPTDTVEKAQQLIAWFADMYRNQEAIQWILTEKSSGDFIGLCGNYALDTHNRKIDIGYNLLPDFWGKGYATEAASTIIAWTFENLNVHRIQADCTEGNIGSEKVLLKCGMTHEGTWRESEWEHEQFVNIKQFSILRPEFEAQ